MKALIESIQNNNINECERLLAMGVDPNGFEDMARIRPIHFAAAYNAKGALLTLLTAGANPYYLTIDDQTAIDIARQQGHTNIIHLLEFFVL